MGAQMIPRVSFTDEEQTKLRSYGFFMKARVCCRHSLQPCISRFDYSIPCVVCGSFALSWDPWLKLAQMSISKVVGQNHMLGTFVSFCTHQNYQLIWMLEAKGTVVSMFVFAFHVCFLHQLSITCIERACTSPHSAKQVELLCSWCFDFVDLLLLSKSKTGTKEKLCKISPLHHLWQNDPLMQAYQILEPLLQTSWQHHLVLFVQQLS